MLTLSTLDLPQPPPSHQQSLNEPLTPVSTSNDPFDAILFTKSFEQCGYPIYPIAAAAAENLTLLRPFPYVSPTFSSSSMPTDEFADLLSMVTAETAGGGGGCGNLQEGMGMGVGGHHAQGPGACFGVASCGTASASTMQSYYQAPLFCGLPSPPASAEDEPFLKMEPRGGCAGCAAGDGCCCAGDDGECLIKTEPDLFGEGYAAPFGEELLDESAGMPITTLFDDGVNVDDGSDSSPSSTDLLFQSDSRLGSTNSMYDSVDTVDDPTSPCWLVDPSRSRSSPSPSCSYAIEPASPVLDRDQALSPSPPPARAFSSPRKHSKVTKPRRKRSATTTTISSTSPTTSTPLAAALKGKPRITHPAIYKCEYPGCTKVFTRSYNLKSHQKIHTGDELFLCEYCPSRFTRGHDLKRH
ncbi:Metallothionein expression activator, partial [Borealophlyctis nickersoniae]